MHELLLIAGTDSTSTNLTGETAATTTLVISSMDPSGPSVTMILQKGRLFFRQTLRRGKSLGATREDRGKGTRLSLIMTGHPQIILPKLLQSLSIFLASWLLL